MTDGLNTAGYVNPLTNPGASNAAIASLMRDTQQVEKPVIALPAGGYVRLPGGMATDAGFVVDAEVRELIGEHEEAITKARQGGVGRFVASLLQCGTVAVGTQPATSEMLSSLLLGDRDMLLMEIRRATYGDELVWDQYSCPNCGEEFRLSVGLDEIPIRKLSDPKDRYYTVALRKGRTAHVRLPIGADQDAVFALSDRATDSERNSLLLSRCIISIVEADGTENGVAGNLATVRALGVMDRKAVLDTFDEKQSGPQFNDVKFTHDVCGKEVPLYINVGDLFQGM